ncbi:MAG: hypothetical protein ACRD5K_07535 [Candidatus Acidiferrales bacterium]
MPVDAKGKASKVNTSLHDSEPETAAAAHVIYGFSTEMARRGFRAAI